MTFSRCLLVIDLLLCLENLRSFLKKGISIGKMRERERDRKEKIEKERETERGRSEKVYELFRFHTIDHLFCQTKIKQLWKSFARDNRAIANKDARKCVLVRERARPKCRLLLLSRTRTLLSTYVCMLARVCVDVRVSYSTEFTTP